MVSFSTLFVAATAFVGALAMPGGNTTRRAGTGNAVGTDHGCV
jgi:hypothetical protein